MLRRPPIPTLTDTLFPYTTLFRSGREMLAGGRLTLPGASAIQFRPREGGLGGEYDRFRRSAGLVTPARRSNGAFALVDVQLRKLAFALRSEEHTSELQSLMRISYAVFCLKKKKKQHNKVTEI